MFMIYTTVSIYYYYSEDYLVSEVIGSSFIYSITVQLCLPQKSIILLLA